MIEKLKTRTSRFKNVLIVVIGLYGAVITAQWLITNLLGELIIPISLLNDVSPIVWLPTLILFPVMLLWRKRIALLLLVPFVVLLLSYAPLLLPHTQAVVDDTDTLTIMTYNLNRANHDAQTVLQIIRSADADIVSLQEINLTIEEAVSTQLAEEYPHQAIHATEGYHGQAVLSRYPIVDDDFWRTILGHQRVELDVDGQVMTLYNVHPIHHMVFLGGVDFWTRNHEITDILSRTATETNPTLLVGDFNMTDQSEDYANVRRQFSDSFRDVGQGMGFTWPQHFGRLPLFSRIDYIFYNDNFEAISAQVWETGGISDHRPYLATLHLISAR